MTSMTEMKLRPPNWEKFKENLEELKKKNIEYAKKVRESQRVSEKTLRRRIC